MTNLDHSIFYSLDVPILKKKINTIPKIKYLYSNNFSMSLYEKYFLQQKTFLPISFPP